MFNKNKSLRRRKTAMGNELSKAVNSAKELKTKKEQPHRSKIKKKKIKKS